MPLNVQRNLLVLAFFVLCLTAAPVACASGGSSLDDYAGNWVMKVGQRNFIVISLKNEGGHLTGTASRPKHFQLTDGLSFSEVSSGIEVGTIARSSTEQGHLSFVVKHPGDKNADDEDDFEMTLTAENKASLKFVGAPIDPWTLSRVQGNCELGVATDWDVNETYMVERETIASSAAMKKIFEEDQRVRQSPATITAEDWKVIDKSDAERREATRKLLAAGQLHSAKDFGEAAFIFQHGDGPDDYLLAHTLAIIAVEKGDSGASWIASATLDRYLQSIGKAQIYGTQYATPPGEPVSQGSYNRELISDALRHELGVPSRGNQEEQLKKYNAPAAKSQ
jgi:hypothetical protein